MLSVTRRGDARVWDNVYAFAICDLPRRIDNANVEDGVTPMVRRPSATYRLTVHTYTRTCTHTHTCVCTHIHTHGHAYMCDTCMRARPHMCACIDLTPLMWTVSPRSSGGSRVLRAQYRAPHHTIRLQNKLLCGVSHCTQRMTGARGDGSAQHAPVISHPDT